MRSSGGTGRNGGQGSASGMLSTPIHRWSRRSGPAREGALGTSRQQLARHRPSIGDELRGPMPEPVQLTPNPVLDQDARQHRIGHDARRQLLDAKVLGLEHAMIAVQQQAAVVLAVERDRRGQVRRHRPCPVRRVPARVGEDVPRRALEGGLRWRPPASRARRATRAARAWRRHRPAAPVPATGPCATRTGPWRAPAHRESRRSTERAAVPPRYRATGG